MGSQRRRCTMCLVVDRVMVGRCLRKKGNDVSRRIDYATDGLGFKPSL